MVQVSYRGNHSSAILSAWLCHIT